MLLDEINYKAPPAIAQPSVAGFKAWLEQQPRDERYEYPDICHCAAAQYMQAIGLGKDWHHHPVASVIDNLAFKVWRDRYHSATFGDVLAEINKAGAA